MKYPEVTFKDEDNGSDGSKLYHRLVPAPEAFIKETVQLVCRTLYKNPYEVPPVKSICYVIVNYEGISEKSGSDQEAEVKFSTKYLTQYYAKHGEKETMDEIAGILVHELTHVFQLSPKNAGGYTQGSEHWSLTEGEADGVRIHTGHTPYSFRKPGGNWKDGYKTTGFFIDWLYAKDPEIIFKLGKTKKSLDPWSWDAAMKQIFHQPVAKLWEEYQTFLQSPETPPTPSKPAQG